MKRASENEKKKKKKMKLVYREIHLIKGHRIVERDNSGVMSFGRKISVTLWNGRVQKQQQSKKSETFVKDNHPRLRSD